MQPADTPDDPAPREALPTPAGPLPAIAEVELASALRTLQRGGSPLVRAAETLAGAINTVGMRAARHVMHAPPGLDRRARRAAEAALARAFRIAVLGLPRHPLPGRGALARATVTASGALGGLYGLAGLFPDLGVSTLAIMREIARIAREEGEDLATESGRRACLEIFLLTPPPVAEGVEMPEHELSYVSARLMLRGAPLVALLQQAAGRYGVLLSEKLATQAVPLIGAAFGVALNNAFLSHYRELARAHFTIRRLERAYGERRVHAAAQALADILAERNLGQPA